MADEIIGSAAVTIEGDYGPLAKSFQDATTVAQRAGEGISTALTQSLSSVGPAADVAAAELTKTGHAAEEAGREAQGAEGGFHDLLEGMLAFAGIELGVEALKEFGAVLIEVSDSAFRTATSLGALTGSATETIETMEKLEEIASSKGLEMEGLEHATVRMTAMLPAGTDVTEVLGHLADAAAVMGTDIEGASNAFDRIVNSGTLSTRMLSQLGLTLGDMAGAAGVSRDAIKDLFQNMSETQRVEVLQNALEKFSGVADAAASGVTGTWGKVKETWREIMENMGSAVAPLAVIVLSFANDALKGAAAAFDGLVTVMNSALGVFGQHIQTSGEMKEAAAQAAIANRTEAETVEQSGQQHNIATQTVKAHASAIRDAIATMQAYGLTTLDQAQAIAKSTTEHAAVKDAVAAAAKVMSDFGLTNVDAAKSVLDHAGALEKLTVSMIGSTQAMRDLASGATEQAAAVAAAKDSWIAKTAAVGKAADAEENLLATSGAWVGGLTAISTATDISTAATANLASAMGQLSGASDDIDAVTKRFDALASGVEGTSKSVGGMTQDLDTANESGQGLADTFSGDLSDGISRSIEGVGKLGDSVTKFGDTALRTITKTVIDGALKPMLSNLESIASKFGSLGGLFGGSGGSGGGGGGGGLGSIASAAGGGFGLGNLLGSLVGGSISTAASALGLSHSDTIMARIEENTRYVKIWTGEQSQSILWGVLTTAERLSYVSNTLDTIAGALGGPQATSAAAANIVINVNGANQSPLDIARQIADYLKTVSPSFQLQTIT